MKKICCMIALAAISFSSVYAEPNINSSVKADVLQTHKKKVIHKKKKPMKMKKGTSMGKMKM
ncbi:hypothetical protein DIU31_022380 [Mucilaginibacter rubeus]|uniref:Pentapeptide MXKDX repeat protein n=2 Tax=Mucilaginibacter rubeus TaxID=2027860 RepID=A0A5C1HKK5_9SPHI|nr:MULTISPECIES: hypothetical protein [Mucilaginibacter]QEM06126.1 hypothetical protein DIU31_022380 [Mucilaginibacter rubeus]QEM13643.1 hypothetical protein DEO27_027735 [Mucilaginibacter rubeus]QEM18706.1 hypothetical protein DIU38_022605 [Mucilaginibacter gossypii]QTE36299.1 hypothetical protein J3L18_24690 [Mucilaginibacter gossypii]QTE44752.1 hypothetical protein J3L19_05115 [Mucilaginibacter rubeus]